MALINFGIPTDIALAKATEFTIEVLTKLKATNHEGLITIGAIDRYIEILKEMDKRNDTNN